MAPPSTAGLDPEALLERAMGSEAESAAQESLAAFDRDQMPGVPTWLVDGKRFWGKDRIEWLVREVERING